MEKQTIKNAVIVTDCTDIAFNEMHQSLLQNLADEGHFPITIAPLVPVKNFSVVNAAFSIRLMADCFTHQNTIFIVVVHGVNFNPQRIFGVTKSGLHFVGNNSGYFNWLIQDFGLEILYENYLDRTVNAKSFGGKYVQIPTSAKIIAGKNFSTLGEIRPKEFLVNYNISHGTVVHIDNFGLIKINAPLLQGFKEGEKLKIHLNGAPCITAFYSLKMKTQNDGTWVLFPGSSLGGLPELGKVRCENSAKELNVKEGDVITWERLSDEN